MNQLQHNLVTKLMLFAGLLGCGQTALLICLPSLATNTGLDTAQLGIIVAVGSGVFLIGNPVWGYLSDRWSRKGALLTGLFGYASCFLIMALASHQTSPLSSSQAFLVLLAARILYGLTASAIYPTIQAWALDYVDQNHSEPASDREAKTLTRLAAAVNAGRLIGPVAASPFLLLGPFGVLLFLALLAAALLIIAVFISTPPSSQHHAKAPALTTISWSLMAAAVMVTIILGALQYSLGFLLMSHFASSTDAGLATAVILVLTTLIVITIQIGVVSRLAQPWLTAVPVACCGLVVGCLLLFEGSLLFLFIAIILISAASATLAPAYQSKAAKLSTTKLSRAPPPQDRQEYFTVTYPRKNT